MGTPAGNTDVPSRPDATLADRLFAGEGEMARLIRTTNWSKTSLGPVESWPQSLRTAVSIFAPNRVPIARRGNSFVRKPVNYAEFVDAARQLGLYWLLLNQAAAGTPSPTPDDVD